MSSFIKKIKKSMNTTSKMASYSVKSSDTGSKELYDSEKSSLVNSLVEKFSTYFVKTINDRVGSSKPVSVDTSGNFSFYINLNVKDFSTFPSSSNNFVFPEKNIRHLVLTELCKEGSVLEGFKWVGVNNEKFTLVLTINKLFNEKEPSFVTEIRNKLVEKQRFQSENDFKETYNKEKKELVDFLVEKYSTLFVEAIENKAIFKKPVSLDKFGNIVFYINTQKSDFKQHPDTTKTFVYQEKNIRHLVLDEICKNNKKSPLYGLRWFGLDNPQFTVILTIPKETDTNEEGSEAEEESETGEQVSEAEEEGSEEEGSESTEE